MSYVNFPIEELAFLLDNEVVENKRKKRVIRRMRVHASLLQKKKLKELLLVLKRMKNLHKNVYNTTLSQVFSPCGNFLVAGTDYGDISIFDVKNILKDTDNVTDDYKSKYTHNASKSAIMSLASTKKFLITGSVGIIKGWEWNSVKTLDPKISWSIDVPVSKTGIDKPDVNSLCFKEIDEKDHLYAGCGDNNIYLYSLEDGKEIRKFVGHDDYIHSIDIRGDQLISGSEDGTVKLWDLRQPHVLHTIKPYENTKLARPKLGKWIGDVNISEDWMIFGGGPSLSLWHRSTMSLLKTFPIEDDGIHVAKFINGNILAGGVSKNLFVLNHSGNVISKLDSHSSHIYTAVYNDQEFTEMLAYGGTSGKIDISINLRFRHQSVSVY